MNKKMLTIVGVIVAVLLLVILILPSLIDANRYKPEIQAKLGTALGRNVQIGNIKLSIFSGGVVVDDVAISDDPAFSNQPFLQAASVKINVEMIPLILSRQVRITGFAIDSPKTNLIRHANGTWNYSTIGAASSKAPSSGDGSSSMTGVTVGHVNVTNGQLTVSTESAPGASATPKRTYDQVNLQAKNFAFSRACRPSHALHPPKLRAAGRSPGTRRCDARFGHGQLAGIAPGLVHRSRKQRGHHASDQFEFLGRLWRRRGDLRQHCGKHEHWDRRRCRRSCAATSGCFGSRIGIGRLRRGIAIPSDNAGR